MFVLFEMSTIPVCMYYVNHPVHPFACMLLTFRRSFSFRSYLYPLTIHHVVPIPRPE